MKTSVVCSLALTFGCLLVSAEAQEASTALPAAPALTPTAPPPLTVPPTAPLGNLWGTNAFGTMHVSGDIALGMYAPLGHGTTCGPLYGTSGAINVIGERGGLTVGFSEFTGSRFRP